MQCCFGRCKKKKQAAAISSVGSILKDKQIYIIKNKAFGLVLDTDMTNETFLIALNGDRHQHWRIEEQTNGSWRFRNVLYENLLYSNSENRELLTRSDADVDLKSFQNWKITALSSKTESGYYIRNEVTGLRIDFNLKGKVITSEPSGNDIQVWFIEPATSNLNKLNLCGNPEMTYIHQKLFAGYDKETLTVLNLCSNKIKVIPWNAFNELKNLEQLSLLKNEITIIEERSFNKLVKLKHLDLSQNKITSIYPFTFSELKNLEMLFLNGNEIEVIDERLFKGLTSLKRLNIFKNMIKIIPAAGVFDELTDLYGLYMDNNRIEAIYDGSFRGLSSLRYLRINDNKIKSISSNAFNHLEKLEKLYLNDNELESIDEELFSGLVELTELHLEQNSIKSLPDNVFSNLEKLENLSIDPIGNGHVDLADQPLDQGKTNFFFS
jgi:Leucine-rich repeat (LRR) protein